MRQAPSLRSIFGNTFFVLFVIAVLGGLFWGNLHYAQRYTGGMDFLPFWKGAQNFIYQEYDSLFGPYTQIPISVQEREKARNSVLSPYGEYTALQIGRIVYGRLVHAGEYPAMPDQPFYLFPFYFPLGAIREFAVARAAWMLLLEIALALLTLVTFQLCGWSLRWYSLALIFAFSFLWFPAWAALIGGNGVIVLTLLLVGALRAIDRNVDELAGVFLALGTFYAESGLPTLVFVLFWATFSRRWRVWGGFIMTLALLGFISFILDPNWFWPFARAVLANLRTNPFPSTFGVFETWFPGIGGRGGWFITVGFGGMLAYEWFLSLGRNTRWMIWTACLTLAATPMLGMPVRINSLVILFPPILLAFSVIEQRWGVLGRWLVGIMMGFFFSFIWFLAWVNAATLLFLWLSPVVIMLLYWVRWWLARPARLWADQLAANERPSQRVTR